METVVTVSEADQDSLPAKMADRAVCIGPAMATKSYLKGDTIVTAALGTKADAIHPGYGFLAEQHELVAKCAKHGLIFIGPKADNIKQMGDKLFARKIVKSLGIPMIPGSALVRNFVEAENAAKKVGYPILLKAAAGGGGRGMKIVRQPKDLKATFNEASAEAHSAFGDARLYVEHYIPNARHIEVQLIGDHFGNIVHLFERDCSIQRRYQKMLEEAPSSVVTPEIRKKICDAALSIAHHIQYVSAGTIEFILDQDENRFYFLEMNTRIQVEHPVTEMITGIDLVKEQIRVAAGLPLSFSQGDVALNGHAIECRINAELPDSDFRPCPGKIIQWESPQGNGVRVDTHCYSGYDVPPYYDSLLAKTIVTGHSRFEAIENMQRALENFAVSGVDTTIPFHQFILKNDDYRSGRFNTAWIENTLLKQYGQRK
jgi:acetyl-CoA carboxylase biotin carboxylase subunit